MASRYTYYIDKNTPAEMSRQLRQNDYLTKAQGGLLAGIEGSHFRNVLDIGCGSGGWALDLAFAYPEIDVVGIDISEKTIDFANNQAVLRKLNNVSFRVMNAQLPLDFPDASFDLVNARFLGTFMLKSAWPGLFSQCKRILRVGGILKMTEFERAITNSLSHERISTLLTQSQHILQMGFSPDGNHMGVLPMLGWFFEEEHFKDIKTLFFGIDYSIGQPGHSDWYQNLLMFFRLTQKFLIQQGVAEEEELERLYRRAEVEMQVPEFRALTPCMSMWGSKGEGL